MFEDLLGKLGEYVRGWNQPLVIKGGNGLVAQKYAPPIGQATTPTPTPMPTPTPSPIYEYGQGEKPPIPENLRPTIESEARNYRLDPSVLASLLAQETGGYGYEPVRGASGERGISQIIPELHWGDTGTGATSLEEYAWRLENDPEYAIHEAARILKELLYNLGNPYPNQGEVHPDYLDALSGYNAGLGNLQGGQPYAQEVLGRIGR
jgi:soluble lytic murein transglycosylase-like protein